MNAAQTICNMQTAVGVLEKLCIPLLILLTDCIFFYSTHQTNYIQSLTFNGDANFMQEAN